MRYLSIVSALPTVDGSCQDLSLETWEYRCEKPFDRKPLLYKPIITLSKPIKLHIRNHQFYLAEHASCWSDTDRDALVAFFLADFDSFYVSDLKIPILSDSVFQSGTI